MSDIDKNILRIMFDGAPESWILASTAAVAKLQAALPTDHPFILTKVQDLMELKPSAAPAGGSGGGSALHQPPGKPIAKLPAPTASKTTIDTKLDPDDLMEDDIGDVSGWPLVTAAQGYKTPYFASHKHVLHLFKQDRGVSAHVTRYTLHVHCNHQHQVILHLE
jgi:hypothetical protein